MKKELLDILVCPVCNGKLDYLKQQAVLICKFDRLVYQIEDDIPILLEEKATQVSGEQLEEIKQAG